MTIGSRNLLQTIANTAGKAAEIYPDLIRLMDRAGVPPADRSMVLQYLAFAIGADGTTTPITGGMIQ